MDRRLNVKAVMEIYGCSRQTASRYMRQMVHMENPLMVTEKALLEWEASKTVYPITAGRKRPTPARLEYRKE